MVATSVTSVFAAAVKNRRTNVRAMAPALMLMLGLITQVALGALTILPMYGLLDFLIDVRTPIVTAHVATGAFLLGASFLLSLLSFRGAQSIAARKPSSATGSLAVLAPQKAHL